jgi:hypothetical protein
MFDQDENLRNAIEKLKARLDYFDSILSRPPVVKTRWGMESRPSEGGGIRLHEDRQHVKERIGDLEKELLLNQYRRSIDPLTRNVVAQAAIEKQLAERGLYVQSKGESTSAEMQPETEPNNEASLELGKWADARLAELRTFTRLLRAGRSPESLRTQFSALFTEVIDRLPKVSRESLFEQSLGRLMHVPEMLAKIGDVKELSGAALDDYRKKYRTAARHARR